MTYPSISGASARAAAATDRRERQTDKSMHSPIKRNVLQHKQLQPFNGLFSRTTWVSRYQIGKTNLDFTGARDSEWQWHQLDNMQVCTSLQTDNHASTPPLCFLQAGCPSCRPTNSVKALKAPHLGSPGKRAVKWVCVFGAFFSALIKGHLNTRLMASFPGQTGHLTSKIICSCCPKLLFWRTWPNL